MEIVEAISRTILPKEQYNIFTKDGKGILFSFSFKFDVRTMEAEL